MSGENYETPSGRKFMNAEDFGGKSKGEVTKDERVYMDVGDLNRGLEMMEKDRVKIDPKYQQEMIDNEKKLAEERSKIGGGSPEVHARGFEAPTPEQIYEAEAGKHRAQELSQKEAEQRNKPIIKGLKGMFRRIFNRPRLG